MIAPITFRSRLANAIAKVLYKIEADLALSSQNRISITFSYDQILQNKFFQNQILSVNYQKHGNFLLE
jgi:hypothetical protein